MQFSWRGAAVIMIACAINLDEKSRKMTQYVGTHFKALQKLLTTKVASGFKGTRRRKISLFTPFDILVSRLAILLRTAAVSD